MKDTMLWRLLALMLALVMVLGCLAGCDSKQNGGKDETKEQESSHESSEPDVTEPDETEPTQPKLDLTPTQELAMAGLHIFLPAGSEKTDALDDEYAEYTYGDVGFVVTRGGLVELDLDASDADSVAKYFYDRMSELEEGVALAPNNGVPVITLTGDGTMDAVGIYVAEGLYWMVEATYEGEGVTMDALVRIVSSGWVNAQEIPGYSGPETESTKEIRCEGLVLVMDKDYEVEDNGSTSVYASHGDDLLLVGRFENDGKTTDELLDFSKNAYEQIYSTVEKLEKDGVGYLQFADELGFTNVIVVYVQGDYYWEVSYSGVVEDAALQGVISCLIGAAFE